MKRTSNSPDFPGNLLLASIFCLLVTWLVPLGQATAVTDFGGALDAEHADYYQDDTFAVWVGAELWGCGGGHVQTGTVTSYVYDVNWSCQDHFINHSLCFYGYVEYWYEEPPDSDHWMPVWVISGYYDNCGM